MGKNYIAVDLGAESGRVMLGTVDNETIRMAECHRFINGSIQQDGSLRWDFHKLLSEVKKGIAKVVKEKTTIDGIGIDSWGVDFGLIDDTGGLIENPYHYRDSRNNGIMEKAFDIFSRQQIYENTGIQFLPFNSLYQLLGQKWSQPDVLEKAKHLIFIADLIAYHLCGKIFAEYTLASTSQMMDMQTGQWSKKIFDSFDLPLEIMPNVVKPGTVVGSLKAELANEIDCEQIPVIAVGTHDTASAIAAVPATGENWAYLSSGTWSLMGVETEQAVINEQTFQHSFTNEGGIENTIRLLKNIAGLWQVQECRRQWQQEGQDYSYAKLTDMARVSKSFVEYLNPDDPAFLAPGNMPARINDYLEKTSQKRIDDKGQMIRVILESLALRYRQIVENLETVIGEKIETLHIVGGGSRNELLCQFTADAIGKKVVAGPAEATATGNIIVQAIATGQINSLAQAREIIFNSHSLRQYIPENIAEWEHKYQNYKSAIADKA